MHDEFEVNCVTIANSYGGHEHITHIGSTLGGWRITKESAIYRIESKRDAFFTLDKGTLERSYIGVVREHGQAPYLRAYANGRWNDNLLAQAVCGRACAVII